MKVKSSMNHKLPTWTYDETMPAGVDYRDVAEAQQYDDMHQRFRDYEKAPEMIVKRLGLAPDSTVIDMGAGTGAFAVSAAKYCKRVYAVDVSEAMLALCQAKLKKAGLEALADICQREDLWLHVDGAFGAWAALAPGGRDLVRGMDRADSLAFDLHKWMYMPYEIGCVLVRHEEHHRDAFSLTPAYLAHGEGGRGMTGGDLPWFSDYGYQLSRGFRALKAWMSLSWCAR